MRKSKFTEEQIAFALRQVEGGTAVEQVCRKMGVSEATFYRWKKQFGGMGGVDAFAIPSDDAERPAGSGPFGTLVRNPLSTVIVVHLSYGSARRSSHAA